MSVDYEGPSTRTVYDDRYEPDKHGSHGCGCSAESAYFASVYPPLYEVGEIDGIPFITLRDGSTLSDPGEVRHFITHTPRGHAIMNEFDTTDDNYQVYAAQDIPDMASAQAWVEAHDGSNGVIQWIGAGAKSVSEQREAGMFWKNLDPFPGQGITLDVDPEIPGRPVGGRPGVAQLRLIELPPQHRAYQGAGTIGVVLYHPTLTRTYERIVVKPAGGSYTEVVSAAKSHTPSGYKALVTTFMASSSETLDEWLNDGYNAVATLAGRPIVGDTSDEDAAIESAERLQARMARLANL